MLIGHSLIGEYIIIIKYILLSTKYIYVSIVVCISIYYFFEPSIIILPFDFVDIKK